MRLWILCTVPSSEQSVSMETDMQQKNQDGARWGPGAAGEMPRVNRWGKKKNQETLNEKPNCLSGRIYLLADFYNISSSQNKKTNKTVLR